MNKIKGIVVEQTKENVVILTPDGRFIKGEADQQEIGSESRVSPAGLKSRLQLATVRRPFAVAALFATFLLILLTSLFLPLREPALAFIQLEVNPAVEFGIDRDGKIRELTPLNEDGSALIQDLGNWNGKDVTVLIGGIIAEYSAVNQELSVISVKAGDEKLAAKVNQTVRFIKDAAREKGMELRLLETDSELRDRAMAEGVPISRIINRDSQAPHPPASEHSQQKSDKTQNEEHEIQSESIVEKKQNPETGDGQDQDARQIPSGNEEVRPPGNSGQAPGIRKKEAPPGNGTQGKPAEEQKPPVHPNEKGQGHPPVKGEQKEKTKEGVKKQPSKPGNNESPPINDGPAKKAQPPGHSRQEKQSGPPDHARPHSKDRPDEKMGGNRVSPSQKQHPPGAGQSSDNGQENKNGGNGKGGNGNGSGK
ncbi:anti-sigma-I factor RsgI family protein [Bhargavaea beijingensis]|nr:hypothetical protein [Bhargavaea beijingensis]